MFKFICILTSLLTLINLEARARKYINFGFTPTLISTKLSPVNDTDATIGSSVVRNFNTKTTEVTTEDLSKKELVNHKIFGIQSLYEIANIDIGGGIEFGPSSKTPIFLEARFGLISGLEDKFIGGNDGLIRSYTPVLTKETPITLKGFTSKDGSLAKMITLTKGISFRIGGGKVIINRGNISLFAGAFLNGEYLTFNNRSANILSTKTVSSKSVTTLGMLIEAGTLLKLTRNVNLSIAGSYSFNFSDKALPEKITYYTHRSLLHGDLQITGTNQVKVIFPAKPENSDTKQVGAEISKSSFGIRISLNLYI